MSAREKGFTLIELMVSAAIVIVVVTGITQAFTTQHQTYMVVDQLTEAQKNLRAVSDLMERDVRRAGYMVPPQAAVCAYDATTTPDTLFLSNADVIRTVFALEDENEDLSGSFGAPVTGVSQAWNASGGSFALTLERLWVDVAADGDDFRVGEGVIVVNRRRPDAQVACGVITALGGTTLTVDFGASSTGPVGLNADVVAVPAHVYAVSSAGNGRRLLRDGRLLAAEVEDLQLTFFFDQDDDRVADPGELFAAAGGAAQPWELLPVTGRPDFSTLREVGVNVVTVTRDDDPNPDFRMGAGQAVGNRDVTSLPSGDGKRRRVSSARVRLRNGA